MPGNLFSRFSQLYIRWLKWCIKMHCITSSNLTVSLHFARRWADSPPPPVTYHYLLIAAVFRRVEGACSSFFPSPICKWSQWGSIDVNLCLQGAVGWLTKSHYPIIFILFQTAADHLRKLLCIFTTFPAPPQKRLENWKLPKVLPIRADCFCDVLCGLRCTIDTMWTGNFNSNSVYLLSIYHLFPSFSARLSQQ